jgi:hypothetical protein
MIRRLWRSVIVAALILAPQPSAGQLAASHVEVDATVLQPGVDSLAIYLSRNGQLQRLGTLWDELSRIDSGGVSRLRRVYRTTNALFGAHLDTIYSTWTDLRPISRTTDAAGMRAAIVFRRDSIVGWTHTPPQGRRVVALRADPALYDGSSFDLMLRATRLHEGAAVAVRAFTGTADTTVVLRARVVGTDRLAIERGASREAWVVEMDFAGLASTLWIDKQSRALIHQIIRLGPGVAVVMARVGVDPAAVRRGV